MNTRPKAPDIATTLKHIQRKRLAYGGNERTRFVEQFCAILMENRTGFRTRPKPLVEHFTLSEPAYCLAAAEAIVRAVFPPFFCSEEDERRFLRKAPVFDGPELADKAAGRSSERLEERPLSMPP